MNSGLKVLSNVGKIRRFRTIAALHRNYSRRIVSCELIGFPILQKNTCNSTLNISRLRPMTFYSDKYFYSTLPSHKVITLPNLSPTMETGTIVSWAKQKGDKVEEGDLLAEIETDKATMSMEASETGIIAKILLPAGSKDILIGTALCVMVENEADVEAFKDFEGPKVDAAKAKEKKVEKAPESPKPSVSKPTTTTSATTSSSSSTTTTVERSSAAAGGDRVFISPLARKKAEELGISINNLFGQGSGPWGDVRVADVQRFIESGGAQRASAGGGAIDSLHFTPGESFTDLQLTGMRKTIAKRLSESKQTIPHYYLTVDICLDQILPLRERINLRLQKEGVKLSVNDFLIKAAAMACQQIPECNSAWMDSFIRQYTRVDVSVAVATPNGLITPIVFGVETKGLKTINQDVQRLAEKARQGKLQPQEFQGGTFTISNLGMFGIKQFSAIINPPQACILAVGGAEKRVVPDAKAAHGFHNSTYVSVTLCCDHRVVDGAVGAQWLSQFKQYLEDPSSMLL